MPIPDAQKSGRYMACEHGSCIMTFALATTCFRSGGTLAKSKTGCPAAAGLSGESLVSLSLGTFFVTVPIAL